MSYWPGFLSLFNFSGSGAGGGEGRHTHHRKGTFSGTKIAGATRFPPRWHLGVARARQRRAPCPAGAFLVPATIRQFQPKIPRITPEPGSTRALGLVSGFGEV